jgi:trigger factor
MQVTIEEQTDSCTVMLDITVEAERVAKAFDRAYRKFAGFTNVPGFRPGKAPRQVLERFVNRNRLREHVRELIVNQAYREALQEKNITPYAEPEADISDVVEGQPYHFKVTVQTPPRVTLGDCSTIAVERPVYAVSEEDIDGEIEKLRAQYARLEQAHDRGIREDDQVIFEMKVTLEGEEPPAEPRRSLIRITRNNIPGFNEAVMGQMPGEERRFTLAYPDDFQDAERAGKSAGFEVKVISINQTVIPEATDEWVGSVTAFETVEALRAALRADRERALKSLADNIAENRILDALVKLSDIAYPATMLEEEIADEMRELHQDLEQRRLTYEQYLEMTGQTREQHEEQVAQRAEDRLKSLLVMREMAKSEKIETSSAEIDAEFTRLAEENAISDEDLQRMKGEERRRIQIANIILRRKLRDRLFELATITDVPAGS